MSLPKSASMSSKSKDLHDHGVSSFERATLLFKEIEHFIESELADTPSISASYEIPRMKSKRKRGPYLIRPLNKSKARKTLNDMEYDPIKMEWMGNVGALKTFGVGRPALITNKANNFRPKTEGKMIWNAKEQKWEGNWDDLRPFEKRKPPLIKSIATDVIPKEWRFVLRDSPNVRRRCIGNIGDKVQPQCTYLFDYERDRNGMSFNPVTMTWEGNFEALLDFGTISEESNAHDDGFAVGTEFQLSPATIQLFADCAARHTTSTSGWWREEKSREHLSAIRTMSIMRLVRDAKRAAFAFEEPSYMDIASNDSNVPKLKSPHAEPEVDFDDADAWDDIGPFNGTVRLKLPEATSAEIDLDLDQELSKFGSVSTRGKINIVDEDWDGDFAEDLQKVLPRRLSTHKPIPFFDPNPSTSIHTTPILTTPSSSSTVSTPTSAMNGTITNLGKKNAMSDKKPFALLKADAPHRKSYHDLNTIRASPKVAWDEDEEDGLEIPAEPLKLKLNRAPSAASASEDELNDGDFDDDDEVSDKVSDKISNHEEAFDDREVEEEDWNDVELPPTALGEPLTRRLELHNHQSYQPPEKEEWDDFEIPPEKLELKLSQHKLPQQQQQQQQPKSTKKTHKGKAEEEDLDGLDIPDGFKFGLKR